MSALTLIDLFSGAGGLSIGMEKAGFQSLCAVEIMPEAAQTYALHSPHAEVFNTDIVELSFHDYHGIDLVVGGPPCQPFSRRGKLRTTEDERDQIPEFLRVLSEIQPKAFLMENVRGLASRTRKDYLKTLLPQFEALGFTLQYKVLKASDYEVPQKRERFFLVGMRDKTFQWPEKSNKKVVAGDVISKEGYGEPNKTKITYMKKPVLNSHPYAGMLFNGAGRPIDLTQLAPTIMSAISGNGCPWVDTEGLLVPYYEHLMAGGEPYIGEFPGRRISMEEAAALQTFPPEIEFCGSWTKKLAQIGNAVPPKLAEHLGYALMNQLNLS